MTATAAPTATADAPVQDAVGSLDQAVEGLAGLDVDVLDERAIGQALAGAERSIRQLQALQARLANTLSRRRAQQARARRPDGPRAAQKAARAVRGELTDRLGITPSQSKQLVRTGAQLEHLPLTAEAYRRGLVTSAHVRVIDEVTAHFNGDRRAQFEEELVALAQRCRDAVEFGRQARGRLIELDHDDAMADLDRKKARRSARVAQPPDGSTHLALDTAGYEGELVHTVVDAFRAPDTPGQHRTAEQRTHDAVMAAFEAALRAGTASTQHGVRPHVSLVIRAESLRPRTGAAEASWIGPLPYAEVARPAWCQVAHLGEWFVDGGKLAPDTAGLLCTSGNNHHATFDRGDYEVTWTDGRPVVHPPGRQRMASEARATYSVATTGRDPTGTSPARSSPARTAAGVP